MENVKIQAAQELFNLGLSGILILFGGIGLYYIIKYTYKWIVFKDTQYIETAKLKEEKYDAVTKEKDDRYVEAVKEFTAATMKFAEATIQNNLALAQNTVILGKIHDKLDEQQELIDNKLISK